MKQFLIVLVLVATSIVSSAEEAPIFSILATQKRDGPLGPEADWVHMEISALLATNKDTFVDRWTALEILGEIPEVDFEKYSILLLSRYYNNFIGKKLIALDAGLEGEVVNVSVTNQSLIGCFESIGTMRYDLVIQIPKTKFLNLKMFKSNACPAYNQPPKSDFSLDITQGVVTRFRL